MLVQSSKVLTRYTISVQEKGMGLWDVGATWRDEQSLYTPPNCINTFYKDIPSYLSQTFVATVNCADFSAVGCAENLESMCFYNAEFKNCLNFRASSAPKRMLYLFDMIKIPSM